MPNRNTKIIATIGPSSLELPVLRQLAESGMDIIRINTAYGDAAQYDLILENLLKVDPKRKIEIILDIKSLDALEYAADKGIKMIALSFAESAQQVEEVKEKISGAFVISKIESQPGVAAFTEILAVSEGIMVARGDLATAVSLEKVPPLQKQFTRKTLEAGKMLIAATEMLLSMVSNPQPTRAEVSDVANAVFDHSTAVMLSEETAIGKHPVEAVAMMHKIIVEAENWNQNGENVQ
jgi:pyruvate kinase